MKSRNPACHNDDNNDYNDDDDDDDGTSNNNNENSNDNNNTPLFGVRPPPLISGKSADLRGVLTSFC